MIELGKDTKTAEDRLACFECGGRGVVDVSFEPDHQVLQKCLCQ